MKRIKRFNESIEDYPKEIIATRPIYQSEETMLWNDKKISMEDCNNYLDAVNVLYLNNVREEEYNTILEYYEIVDGYSIEEGHTENIIEISKKNLDYLIEFKIIEVIK